MLEKPSGKLRLEIGHILFLDIVGYSKLLMGEQSEALLRLNETVRATEAVRQATASNSLLLIPTGGGMALVFAQSLELSVEAAVQISRGLSKCHGPRVRMGLHSGPVQHVTDISGGTNIAGAGINLAHRVMSCGDAGHILLSRHVAENLESYSRWQPLLQDVGKCRVKHNVRLHLFSLHGEDFGNPAIPGRLQSAAKQEERASRKPWLVAAIVGALALISAATWERFHRFALPSAGLPEKSIAVLPFANLSDERENAYFADGIQDEILTDLARIADLKVISRTSVMQYKTGAQRNMHEIGRQLGVAHLLEGTVQRAANKIRIQAQLIDARTDTHQWAQVYDRPLDDVFAIQSEIAKAIADQLQAKLLPTEEAAINTQPTTDLVAFDEYSRARTLLLSPTFAGAIQTSKVYLQAIDNLNKAIARDPSFFEAYCQLVDANDRLYAVLGDHTPERVAQAESALQGAVRLRPEAPETHLARATHLYYALRNYNGALAELALARSGLSNDPRLYALAGYILRREEKSEEGLQELQRATELDPRNTQTLQQLAASYRQLFRLAEQAAIFERILSISPDDVNLQLNRAQIDFYWKADTRPWHQTIDRVRTEHPEAIADVAPDWFSCSLEERNWAAAQEALVALGESPFYGDNTITLSRHFGEGLLGRAMHDDAKATLGFAAARVEQEQLVVKQKDYGPAICVLGLIDAGLGNKELALEEGRRAMELMPVEKDSTNGRTMQIYFAIIAAWVGEKDLALEQLIQAGSTPGASGVANYGMLKLDPFWEPLRGDLRFENIVASKAPKEAR